MHTVDLGGYLIVVGSRTLSGPYALAEAKQMAHRWRDRMGAFAAIEIRSASSLAADEPLRYDRATGDWRSRASPARHPRDYSRLIDPAADGQS